MAAIHGKNAYAYTSGKAIAGANAWSVSVTKDVVEATEFGDTWKAKVVGQKDGSGSLTAWQYQDRRELIDCVAAATGVSLYLYPDRSDTSNYIYGMVIFTTYSGDGSTSSAVGGNADFVTYDNNGLTFMGFA
jgi:hypothetical protein